MPAESRPEAAELSTCPGSGCYECCVLQFQPGFSKALLPPENTHQRAGGAQRTPHTHSQLCSSSPAFWRRCCLTALAQGLGEKRTPPLTAAALGYGLGSAAPARFFAGAAAWGHAHAGWGSSSACEKLGWSCGAKHIPGVAAVSVVSAAPVQLFEGTAASAWGRAEHCSQQPLPEHVPPMGGVPYSGRAPVRGHVQADCSLL